MTVFLLHSSTPIHLTATAASSAGMGSSIAILMMIVLAVVLIGAIRVLGRIVVQMAEIMRLAGSALGSVILVIAVAAVFLIVTVHSIH